MSASAASTKADWADTDSKASSKMSKEPRGDWAGVSESKASSGTGTTTTASTHPAAQGTGGDLSEPDDYAQKRAAYLQRVEASLAKASVPEPLGSNFDFFSSGSGGASVTHTVTNSSRPASTKPLDATFTMSELQATIPFQRAPDVPVPGPSEKRRDEPVLFADMTEDEDLTHAHSLSNLKQKTLDIIGHLEPTKIELPVTVPVLASLPAVPPLPAPQPAKETITAVPTVTKVASPVPSVSASESTVQARTKVLEESGMESLDMSSLSGYETTDGKQTTATASSPDLRYDLSSPVNLAKTEPVVKREDEQKDAAAPADLVFPWEAKTSGVPVTTESTDDYIPEPPMALDWDTLIASTPDAKTAASVGSAFVVTAADILPETHAQAVLPVAKKDTVTSLDDFDLDDEIPYVPSMSDEPSRETHADVGIQKAVPTVVSTTKKGHSSPTPSDISELLESS